MIYKVLIAGIGLAVSYVVARKMSEMQANARVKVKTNERERVRTSRLRQDPQTGIYHPED
ncbi:MAG: hypothetical protein WBD37_08735 [Anderseniella sp.]